MLLDRALCGCGKRGCSSDQDSVVSNIWNFNKYEKTENVLVVLKKNWVGHSIALHDMSGRPGSFHKKHGQHIRLLEQDTVAHRVDSYNKAVVFTEQPIAQGSMFQVKLLDKGGGWAGSIRFGFTDLCPEDGPVPSGALDLYRSTQYWILSASTLHHNGKEKRVDFNLESLRVGQTVGCMINNEGELRYFINGVDQGVTWTDMPTDKPMWGFADIYGLSRKIQSEFLFDEVMSCSEDSDLDITG